MRLLFIAGLLLATATPSCLGFTVVRTTSRQTTSLNAAVGVFFGTSTGNTENAADLIVAELDGMAEGPIDIDSIQGTVAAEFAKHDALIVCSPTWNTGAETERSGTGWDEIYYGELQELNLQGKMVGVVGLGDSVSYSENYADAAGELHDVFESLGAKMMGYTSQEGYEHEDSKSIRGDLFCGLLLDAVNQEELTEGRVQKWIAQLKEEGLLDGAASAAAPAVVAEPVAAAAEPVAVVVEPVAASSTKTVEQLEKENAELRQLLEENSRLLDENITHQGADANGYLPHVNAKTGKTMWSSPDGRSAYYTLSPPKTITKATP